MARGISLLPAHRAIDPSAPDQFVQRLSEHDPDAWHDLFDLNYDRVFDDACRITGDPSRAAAVAAHVFVEAPSRSRGLRRLSDLVTLLAQITRREATRRAPSQGHAGFLDEDQRRASRAWSAMGLERWVLLARLREGRSASTVASMFGIAEADVRERQLRGLRAIARHVPEARL